MATEKQIAANRRNAQKSTGPRTPEGKAKSARNALKHGLAAVSHHAFLAVEDKSAFERLLHGYMKTYQPNHADEVDLITEAVYCKWRQQRIWNVETQLIEMTMAIQQHDLQRKLPKANIPAHVSNGVTQSTDASYLNRRYEAQLNRQYLRSLKFLRELQAERLDWEPTLEDLEPDTQPTAPAATPPSPAAAPTPATSVPTNPEKSPAREQGDSHTQGKVHPPNSGTTKSSDNPPKAA